MPDRSERRDELVRSAIELLDDGGLDGLSMRRLSQRTGASATSVYWYVESKEALIALTLDAVITEIDLPDPRELGWRESAAKLARDFRAMLLRHPWIGLVAATHQGPIGPRLARHNERVIEVFEAAGFEGGEATAAEAAVYSYVLGSALGEAGPRAWRAGAEPASGSLDAEVSVEEFPRLAARIGELRADDAAPDADGVFEFGLAAVLDGLAARGET